MQGRLWGRLLDGGQLLLLQTDLLLLLSDHIDQIGALLLLWLAASNWSWSILLLLEAQLLDGGVPNLTLRRDRACRRHMARVAAGKADVGRQLTEPYPPGPGRRLAPCTAGGAAAASFPPTAFTARAAPVPDGVDGACLEFAILCYLLVAASRVDNLLKRNFVSIKNTADLFPQCGAKSRHESMLPVMLRDGVKNDRLGVWVRPRRRHDVVREPQVRLKLEAPVRKPADILVVPHPEGGPDAGRLRRRLRDEKTLPHGGLTCRPVVPSHLRISGTRHEPFPGGRTFFHPLSCLSQLPAFCHDPHRDHVGFKGLLPIPIEVGDESGIPFAGKERNLLALLANVAVGHSTAARPGAGRLGLLLGRHDESGRYFFESSTAATTVARYKTRQ